jgi:hypothetical protein
LSSDFSRKASRNKRFVKIHSIYTHSPCRLVPAGGFVLTDWLSAIFPGRIRQEEGGIDTAYLKAVDSIAPILGNDDSLPQRLAVYREIAFGEKIKGSWKAKYYSYMAITRRIGARNIAGVIRFALQHGIISLEDL